MYGFNAEVMEEFFQRAFNGVLTIKNPDKFNEIVEKFVFKPEDVNRISKILQDSGPSRYKEVCDNYPINWLLSNLLVETIGFSDKL